MDRIKQLYILATGIAKCEIVDKGNQQYEAMGFKVDLPQSFWSVSAIRVNDQHWRDSFTHQQLHSAIGREVEEKAMKGQLDNLPSA